MRFATALYRGPLKVAHTAADYRAAIKRTDLAIKRLGPSPNPRTILEFKRLRSAYESVLDRLRWAETANPKSRCLL